MKKRYVQLRIQLYIIVIYMYGVVFTSYIMAFVEACILIWAVGTTEFSGINT